MHAALRFCATAALALSAGCAHERAAGPAWPAPAESRADESRAAASRAAASRAAASRCSAWPPPTSAQGDEPPPAVAPLAVARELILAGDNTGAIAVLREPRSQQEMELLIHVYQTVGDSESSYAAMRRYVELCPETPRAADYRRRLAARR